MANNLVGVAHVLLAIGFEVAVERMNIMAAGICEFEDFRYLVEKDIRDMADEFAKRSVAWQTVRLFLDLDAQRN